MKYYNDKDNNTAAKVMFMVFQIFMLLIVYGFIYSALIAVKLAISEYGLIWLTYLPEILALIGFPVILYKTRRMFEKEKRVRAIGYVMGWSALIIVMLYMHLSQIVKT